MAYSVISRAGWGAKPPTHTPETMPVPQAHVWIHHSVTDASSSATGDMRTLQNIAFGRGFADVSYSFAVHPSGAVLEGRGWGIVGAHTLNYNSTSHGIVFIGDFTKVSPTREALDACRWLIAEGVRLGKISSPQHIGGHRDVYATACPGPNLYDQINYIRTPLTSGVKPMYSPALVLEPIVASLKAPGGGEWLLAASGAVYAFDAPYAGGASGQQYFAGRKAARLEIGPPGKTYTIVSESGERYDY
jgi:N-acetylmuramoyl-L-alanine amidase.